MGNEEQSAQETTEQNSWRFITNAPENDLAHRVQLLEVQGLEVRTVPARGGIAGMYGLEVRQREYQAPTPGMQVVLDKIKALDPHSGVGVQELPDGEAKWYRGTTLGYVLVALKDYGLMRSFAVDREGVEQLQTTVVSDVEAVSRHYALQHAPSAKQGVNDSDIKGISSGLGISPDIVRQHPALLLPVVLHFNQTVHATENPKFNHDYQTNVPVDLFTALTSVSRQHVESLVGMPLPAAKDAVQNRQAPQTPQAR